MLFHVIQAISTCGKMINWKLHVNCFVFCMKMMMQMIAITKIMALTKLLIIMSVLRKVVLGMEVLQVGAS